MNDGEPFIELAVHHARFLSDTEYREQMRAEVLRLDRGALTMVDGEHDEDESCCALEPWSVTLLRLLHARP